MYDMHKVPPCPYYTGAPTYYSDYPCPYFVNSPMTSQGLSNANNYHAPYMNKMPYYDYRQHIQEDDYIELADYGPKPFVVDIDEATSQNNTFRTALWTGEHLQVTLMSIGVGEDIGFEVHEDTDQFLRIEEGAGMVLMGTSPDQIYLTENVGDDYAVFVPAGTWHNLINTGSSPIKLYSIYAPPNHPHGTVHETKADASE